MVNQFYKGDCEIVERQSRQRFGKIVDSFEISQNLEGSELKIYAYNQKIMLFILNDLGKNNLKHLSIKSSWLSRCFDWQKY